MVHGKTGIILELYLSFTRQKSGIDWHWTIWVTSVCMCVKHTVQNINLKAHDDVIEWKHIPRCWPFVWGIHRSHTHTTPISPPPHPTHHHTPTPPPYESWSFSHCITYFTYHQASNIRRIKCQRLNVYCLVVQLYLSIDWSHVLSQEWICSWSSADRRVNDWTAIGIAELSTHL